MCRPQASASKAMRKPRFAARSPSSRKSYDTSPRTLRQRTVNFAAKRLVDMRYVSRLDRITAEQHFRWRPAVAPGGLAFRDDGVSET